jgi:hypothetical protein
MTPPAQILQGDATTAESKQRECLQEKARYEVTSSLAGGAVTADFRTRNFYANVAILFNLGLQFFVEAAFEFTDASAAQTSHVNVIARSMTLVEMSAAAQMEQVELVHQPVTFQKIERTVNGDARDARVDAARAAQQTAGVQMSPCGFHHLQQNAPLVREPHSSRCKLLLQTPRFALDVDALAGGYAMRRRRRAFLFHPLVTAFHSVRTA